MTKQYRLIALSKPVEGKEQEFHDWYDNTHIPQILALPGFTAAQRFKLTQPLGPQADSFPFLTIYEAETDDFGATLGALIQASQSGNLTPSDAADKQNYTAFYEVHAERVTK